jgi:hypothetical protein
MTMGKSYISTPSSCDRENQTHESDAFSKAASVEFQLFIHRDSSETGQVSVCRPPVWVETKPRCARERESRCDGWGRSSEIIAYEFRRPEQRMGWRDGPSPISVVQQPEVDAFDLGFVRFFEKTRDLAKNKYLTTNVSVSMNLPRVTTKWKLLSDSRDNPSKWLRNLQHGK